MEIKLFVSEEAIKKFGKDYFKDFTVEDFKSKANNEVVELEDGMLLKRDDMYNLYLSENEYDNTFNEVSNIK